MSSLTMRHHALTLSFIPFKREHEKGRFGRTLRLAISQRKMRKFARQILHVCTKS